MKLVTFNELTKTLPIIPREELEKYTGPMAPDKGGYLQNRAGEISMVASGETYFNPDNFIAWEAA